MTRPPEPPPLDVARILRTLDQHEVTYIVVGGGAANAHGALNPTLDLDCVAERTAGNLARLAAAMRELNAHLRVAGLDDTEAAQLPVQIDADSLARMELSTWRTDAGDVDILANIPDRGGELRGYAQLAERAITLELDGVVVQVAALADVIASKEWADRPKDREALPELYELRDRAGESEDDR